MAQEPVRAHEVLTRADPGQKGREQPPEQFQYGLSIADLRWCEVLPPDRLRMGRD
jgi:hypothetical protein